jgi:hypothetical protein
MDLGQPSRTAENAAIMRPPESWAMPGSCLIRITRSMRRFLAS